MGRGADGPSFWGELYWFALISVGGVAFAILVLAPRLARHESALDLEQSLRAGNQRIAKLEAEYEAGLEALENDPFYREELMRAVLKVKRADEEFLQPKAGEAGGPAAQPGPR